MKDVIILEKLEKKKSCQGALQTQLRQQKWLEHQVLLILLEDMSGR